MISFCHGWGWQPRQTTSLYPHGTYSTCLCLHSPFCVTTCLNHSGSFSYGQNGQIVGNLGGLHGWEDSDEPASQSTGAMFGSLQICPPPCITGSVFTSRANFKGIEVLNLLCIIPYTASQQQNMRAGGTSDVKELLTISLVHHPKEFTSELFSNATFVYYSSYDN